MTAETDLAAAYQKIRAEGVRVAGGPGDIPQRVGLLHSIYVDSGGNHAFPEVALHGALWAYGFYERRGTVNRLISQRYFYDHEERAQRAYMLFTFSQGFKEANRSVFLDTYTNYFFTKAHGETPGADHVLPPQLLDALNRVHHAAHRGRELTRSERGDVFTTALLFEQEKTVGPKVKSEVAKFSLRLSSSRSSDSPTSPVPPSCASKTSATRRSGSRRPSAATNWPSTLAGTASAGRFTCTASSHPAASRTRWLTQTSSARSRARTPKEGAPFWSCRATAPGMAVCVYRRPDGGATMPSLAGRREDGACAQRAISSVG